MQGLHLIADAYELQCDTDLLVRSDRLESLCGEAARAAGLTVLSTSFYAFDAPPPAENSQSTPSCGGVTGMVLLAESHVAIHTWPELEAATLDVYVCNYQRDNRAKAQALFDALLEALRPARVRTEQVMRGDLSEPDSGGPLELEWLSKEMVFGLRVRSRLHSEHSPWQHIQVFDTHEFGRVLKIDKHFMTSEQDEFFYHEALVHPAAITHPAPRTALIVGGGDGGAARQLLQHNCIERIILTELDESVVRVSRNYMDKVHQGSFDDPRVELRIGDGLAHLAGETANHDLILFDLTDPDTPAHPLYTWEAFALAKSRLAPGGAFVAHVGSPTFGPDRVRALVGTLREIFVHVRLCGTYVPLYGSYWCMALCSDKLDPLLLDEAAVARRMRERGLAGLSLYSPRMHSGLFALPAFVEALIA